MTAKQGLIFGMWIFWYYLMGMVVLPAINPAWARTGPWFNWIDALVILGNFGMTRVLFPEENNVNN